LGVVQNHFERPHKRHLSPEAAYARDPPGGFSFGRFVFLPFEPLHSQDLRETFFLVRPLNFQFLLELL
jgi:hypothetical protein